MKNFEREISPETMDRDVYLGIRAITHPKQPVGADTPEWVVKICNSFRRKWERSFLIGPTFIVSSVELRDPMINSMIEVASSNLPSDAKYVVVSNYGYMADGRTVKFSECCQADVEQILKLYMNNGTSGSRNPEF